MMYTTPIVHPIMRAGGVGPGELEIFNLPCKDVEGLPLGKMVHLCMFKVVCTRHDAIVFEDPPMVMTLVLRFHIMFIPT